MTKSLNQQTNLAVHSTLVTMQTTFDVLVLSDSRQDMPTTGGRGGGVAMAMAQDNLQSVHSSFPLPA